MSMNPKEGHGAGGAGNGYTAFFERLAHGFQDAAPELGQFIEKEHAMMRQRNFAGRRVDVAAEQPGIAGGMMRSAERPAGHQGLSWREQADDAMDLRSLQRLFQRVGVLTLP